jgi:hypothetical protein
MKKQILNFESNALSRKEMKSVSGGFPCPINSCTLTIIGKGQQSMTLPGTCKWGGTGCYCETGIGQTILSSNGGNSRCNA